MDLGAPGSYMTLTPGVAVLSSDGPRPGTVAHVLAEPKQDIFDGIVVASIDAVLVAAQAGAHVQMRKRRLWQPRAGRGAGHALLGLGVRRRGHR
jgi:hypothetical protein